MIAQEKILVHSRIAPFEDVHVDVALRSAHEAMSRLPNAQFVARLEKRIKLVFFGGDVVDRNHDVDDRLRCQSGN